MKNLNFYSLALGCKVNQYDLALLKKEFLDRGWRHDKNNPALVIINTCAVTKKAITKDRQVYHKLKNLYPQARFLLMGCWPQTALDLTAEGDDLIFWGVGDNAGLLKKLASLFPSLNDLPVSESGLLVPSDRSRYFLKVGDGCNQFCTYCVIPYARGRIKSRPTAELIAEAEAATEAGYGEIVLSGIHLGRYGEDLQGDNSLVNLLKKLLEIKDLGRLRLSSIEINEVDESLIALMKAQPQICRHLHISLQSGCDKILKTMNRPYNTDYFRQRVKLLRAAMPEIAISTDIIVGFPGENEEDFNDTLSFAREMGFSKIHVFPFSAHEQTPAFKLPNKVSAAEKKDRAAQLRKMSDELAANYYQELTKKLREKEILVVVEQGPDGLVGKTEFHFDIPVSSDRPLINKLQSVPADL
ncbi:MAG: tRNA (N(6)-L-threonylcarbamoyladenosine(37)-C(2))- methylthiotransferase MtaB [Candidatus Parcubacteria bacterium]|jgi:threonylcarbamoyladenosine tRNA methylthiotransferase MtaB|nr:MAG: tRNA (N(6)-L-threonylcarbamoyladenosine(37)-C(2))-methylthiotransferase MtaB [Candidatus Parcubacteria bacterium]